MKKPKKIMIGTPAYDGKVDVGFLHSLLYSMDLCYKEGIQVFPIQQPYDALVMRARNDLFQIAKESNFDQLIFIDADIRWKPADFMKLIMSDKDVIGGAVCKKNDAGVDFNVRIKDRDKKLILNSEKLVEVIGIGTGFMKISKKTIDKLWETCEKYIENGKEKRNIFEVLVEKEIFYSEDIVFCKKCADNGFQVFLDPYISCSHIGVKEYYIDLMQWAFSQNLIEGSPDMKERIIEFPKGNLKGKRKAKEK